MTRYSSFFKVVYYRDEEEYETTDYEFDNILQHEQHLERDGCLSMKM